MSDSNPLYILSPILALLLGILSFTKPAQSQECTFLKKSHDFEEVISTMVPAAAFPFVNTGNKPLAILRIKSRYETQTKFERKFVEPGDTAYIYVSYQSPQLGTFSDKLEVFTNAGANSIQLNIKGKNISVVECFPNKSNHNIRLVHVIDKQTKEPIENADLSLKNYNGKNLDLQSGKLGKVTEEIPIGQYDITITKEGYYPLQTALYINKSKPVLYFELSRTPKPQKQTIANTENRKPKPAPSPSTGLGKNHSANNLCFLIDVSLSMKQYERMNRLKKAITILIDELRNVDNVSIITYNNATKTLITSVEGTEKDSLNKILFSLTPKGLTNGVKGLEKAYALTNEYFIKDGNNQILLATDGEFAGSGQSEREIKNLIKAYLEKGIKMTVLDFGNEKESNERLKRIATYSGGSYIYFGKTTENYAVILEEIQQQSIVK